MYTRFASLLQIAALVAVVAAAPSPLEALGDSHCDTGTIQCCKTTQEANSATLSELGSLLDIVLPDIGGNIGFGCSPVSVVGLGSGSTCTAQTVCCSNNNFDGFVNLGCSPIKL